MNNLISAVIAIAATMLFLFLREFILSVRKKGRSSFHRRSEETDSPDHEVGLGQRPQVLRLAMPFVPVFMLLSGISTSAWREIRHQRKLRNTHDDNGGRKCWT